MERGLLRFVEFQADLAEVEPGERVPGVALDELLESRAGGFQVALPNFQQSPVAEGRHVVRVEVEGATYLRPTLVRAEHGTALAGTEFLFPFSAVVQVPREELLEAMGPSLVVTALTRDPAFQAALLACSHVERLNLGPVPTSKVDWDQPHEGNLFEFLYARRAIKTVEAW